jgi:hypothetical protein
MNKIITILMICSLPVMAADFIIPADRIFDWNAYTGVEGGITIRTTIYDDTSPANGYTDSLESIDATGATVVRTAIQTAINNCTVGQVVSVPPGLFKVVGNGETAAITMKSGITLRGAGPGRTKFLCDGAAGGFGTWLMTDGAHDYDFNTVTKYNLWTNYFSNQSNLSTTANHTFSAGEYVWMDQRTNTHYIFKQGVPDPCFFCSGANRHADQRDYGQLSKVVSVSNNTNLVIDPPIAGMFQTTNNAQIMKSTAMTTGVGIEGITFTNTQNATAQYHWYLVGVANSWFTNCEFSASMRRFIHTINTVRVSILQCYFHDGIGSDWTASFGPNRAYSIYLAYGSCFNRIEDNIFNHLHFAISFEGAIAGNVAYGNFHTNQIFNNRYTAQPSIGHHGGTATHNLWEHNVVNSMFSLDTYWGPGNNYTIFRNWVRNDVQHDGVDVDQYAIGMDVWKLHRFHNIVGNVIHRR